MVADVAQAFREHERLLFGIAYRMLGSAADAEDMVQDAFLRWQQGGAERADSPRAYLTTVVTRLCIDHLRSARIQRERYTGPWLPEPVVNVGEDATPGQPESDLALADSVSLAFLVMLERLAPVERAVFLLREVFDYDYAEIAAMVDRTEPACRQIMHRARERVRAEKPRFDAPPAQEVAQLTARFLDAARRGDMDGLMLLLADDITVWSDGGGKAVAAQRPIRGAEKVARFICNIVRNAPEGFEARILSVNGQPGVVGFVNGRPYTVGALEIGDGAIQAIRFVVNPDKLARVPALSEL